MAYSDFRDKLQQKRTEAELKYRENSDEAWSQVKGFFTDPTHWVVAAIALLLIVAGVFTVKFFGAIRAPELPAPGVPATASAGQPATVTVPGSEPEPEPEPEVIDDSNAVQPILSGARKEDYYTFLLIATDASSSNTDTLMVVSYDVGNQKLNLMSIPRDTMVNVSWDVKKINSVYGMSGIKGLKRHIGKLIGFVPDFYVKVDLNAFIEVVDLIGGVDFNVPRAMDYDDPVQNLHIHFKAGMQHLNGQQAMEVVRWRKNNRGSSGRIEGYDDTGRIETQQAFLKAALSQALEIRNWTKITGYVEIFQREVESDLELGNMLWFARKAMDLKAEDFMTCTIPGDYYASAWSRSIGSMQSYVTLFPQQVVRLVNESFNPYLSKVTTANLDVMSIRADGSVSSSTGYVADSIAAQPPVIPKDGEEEPEDPEAAEGETPEGETPGTETPGTETPGTDTPGTDTPGTETPGTDTPGTDTPGTETPGTDTPGTETPGTVIPGTETPGTETPPAEQPPVEQPPVEQPPTEQPPAGGAEAQSTDTPPAEQPGET